LWLPVNHMDESCEVLRAMLYRLRLAAAGAAVLFAAGAAAPALAVTGPAPVIGGAQLAGRGVIVDYGAGSVPKLPGVQAAAFVVADAGSGQVLAAKDPHGYYRPASTLKMLTAVTLIPLLNPDGTVVASKQAASTEPNDVGVLPGHSYQISDLFTALLTISANDAAVALTQATGSLGVGMALINAEARHLQADDTVAVDPNGLDAPGQHTSAYDLALIARRALQLPAFLKYDETQTALFPVTKKKKVGLYNQNTLLTSYKGAIGGKIGWTSAAGATYVGMAKRNGVTLIVTLLHCPALTEIDSAEKLLNWGFAADGRVQPVGTLVGPVQPPAPAPVPATAPARQQVRAAQPFLAASSPSVLAAAAFSGVAVIAAGVGFAYSRRQRLAAHGAGAGAGVDSAGNPPTERGDSASSGWRTGIRGAGGSGSRTGSPGAGDSGSRTGSRGADGGGSRTGSRGADGGGSRTGNRGAGDRDSRTGSRGAGGRGSRTGHGGSRGRSSRMGSRGTDGRSPRDGLAQRR
jgi:D-alanyl-D-alanine carboxypeptidase (penicillin-binding protein 5/6)